MIVMINGSFGIGKTTVANLIHNSIPGSIIYDPEWVGFVLKRLPKWIRLKGSETDDYQDIGLWRKSVVMGTRLFRFIAPGPVIVPMTFSRRDYLNEITIGIRRFDTDFRIFCLKASLETIKKRLTERGTKIESTGSEWIIRRITECVETHHDPFFGESVDTEYRPASEIAEDIIKRIFQIGCMQKL